MKINKEQQKYLIPMFVTLVIYLSILCVKRIFPFGSNTIDYYDMAQQIAAFYYHVYDMLHAKTGFFYSFYSALGVNMTMSTSGCSNFSLFNLFFLFIPRNYLLESLSIFHLIKLLAMTFTMYFYLHKTYETPYFFELFLSVGYAFSGFVLMLYITNQWMDIAVMLPVIMFFYDRMMESGNTKGYVIALALTLINSYYLGIMILLFLFLYTGLRLVTEKIFVAPKKRKRHYILEFGFATVLGITLSSFIVVPQLIQTLSSARFENGSGGMGAVGQYLSIIKTVTPAYTTRWFSLFNLSFAAAVIFVGWIRVRSRRLRFFSVGLLFLMLLELVLESVNLIWHFGSYVQYPIRNGFIISFSVASLAGMYAERLFTRKKEAEAKPVMITITEDPAPEKEDTKEIPSDADRSHSTESNGSGMIMGIEPSALPGIVVSVILFGAFALLYKRHPGMQLRTVFHITALLMVLCFIGYTLILLWKKGIHYSLCLILLCFELLSYGFLMYGEPDFVTGYGEEPEQEGEYIRICRQLRKAFELEEGVLVRIKNPDESLNSNYGFVLERSALTNWTHMISPSLQKSAGEWGYTTEYTRILDAGGTAFTDALLGIRDVVSAVPLDEELYEPVDTAPIVINHLTGETMDYTWYKCRYTLPFGVPVYASAMFDSELENRDVVNLQNQMYRSLTGADTEYEQEISSFIVRKGQLVDETAQFITDVALDAQGVIVKRSVLNKTVTGKKALYLNTGNYDKEDADMTITVIGEESRAVPVPTIGDPLNILYPAHFNNNLVCLGTFEDESVTVVVDTYFELGEEYPVNISELDLGKLNALCDSYADYPGDFVKAGKNTLTFTADVPEAAGSTVMLLPVAYDDGWSLRVNNKKSDILYSYSGLFTAIPLYSGINTYTLKFFPSGMGIGIVISLMSLAVYIANLIIRKQNIKIIEDEVDQVSRKAEGFMTPLYLALFAVVFLAMYLIPLIAAVVYR
ncbi:MAG: YfhO family protein [Lachnospiraceae bacterium]|nr:YfhO family protein [Lachnospiraceae bacterium]